MTTPEKNVKKRKLLKNIILMALVVILTVAPLLLLKDAKFGGADSEAEKAITEINENYKPWFAPIMKPKSKEVESLIFALQAALGAGFIGYYFGFVRGRRKAEKK